MLHPCTANEDVRYTYAVTPGAPGTLPQSGQRYGTEQELRGRHSEKSSSVHLERIAVEFEDGTKMESKALSLI